ncbi:hypothetical protein BDN67DRAFT_983236 [Paxillus ammoniavirescens]|nr:hypothetical protein BDN67DRAFT_983236 [Paxillus ammoniavirescens]
MDSCKPPNLLQAYATVPIRIAKGRQGAEGDSSSRGDCPQLKASARLPIHAIPPADVARNHSVADLPSTAASGDQVDVDVPVPRHDELDLAYSIKGMYRILDLISEQGSGGLGKFSRIFISQNSLEAFITTVDPRAYVSMTKINFKALDNYIIKPVGVYGKLGVIDGAIAARLLVDTDTSSPTKPTLRSGLYIIRTIEQSGNTKQIFLFYWPQPGTWDDSAAPSVRRNRVTFMRYLTKMCDQVVALISSEHAQTIVWNEKDKWDRMLTFEVAQTNDQESVTVREGFKAFSDRIALPESHAPGSTNTDSVKPFLLFGETSQGFMTVRYQEAKHIIDVFRARTYTRLQLEGHLGSDCLHLSESLDDEALKILARSGIEKRFPQECSKWKHESNAVHGLSKSRAEAEIARTKTKLQEDYPDLGRFLHQAILGEVQRLYPHLDGRSLPAVESPESLSGLIETGIRREYASRGEEDQRRLRVDLIRRLNGMSQQTPHTHTLHINAVEEPTRSHYYGSSWSNSSQSYQISGSRGSQEDPMVIYTVHLMNITTQDQHELQLNPAAIPSPRFRFTHDFKLPQGHSVVRAQLLEGEKLLLVVADRNGNLTVYLEGLAGIDGAIQRGRGKALNRDKIGQDFLLAYDESKRMLGVVSSDRLLLHIFVFDDVRGFQALGGSINLINWYKEGSSICHACFISGTEDLVLVDSQAQARVFSLVTLRFRTYKLPRPATLILKQVPFSVSSTPDGSCLLIAQVRGSEMAVTAYHWDNFGATEGIALDIPSLQIGDHLLVTSLISRSAVHLVTLDFSTHTCQSYALAITRKITEFMFKERGVRGGTSMRSTNTTAHNCIIDCHSEVWTHFPVLPAVQRKTISFSNLRSPRTLIFVTDHDFDMFPSHFAEMIHTFECTTKKPTGDVLKSIRVSAASFAVFSDELCGGRPWNVSQYRAGEWVVDFLCLIPIHIAITKGHRFVPLKDGVYSTDLERSLLGADVNRILDSLSFGWYESLFQSYMASKPVKVVSSMGEQSVGKSFALNHLVDTSFAGSAMRTTEGVWMSVTPTQEALIVALNFEGVHSIERSAQEDTLLVLFNTAISNLVLFRNNFALSRDITGLFQCWLRFRTPVDSLFYQDVVDLDKVEIAREFSLKFQKLVQDEQEANFISRLHAGKLNIIPCVRPVIESKDFYTLFPAVKRRLDQQVVTHRAAGEFLHMMKTLMAKLKANDWGAISQTMASHRAQLISTLLPNALAFGFADIDPEREPLKNLDTDLPVDLPDTPHKLFIAGGGIEQSSSRERTLAVLRAAWDQQESRQYAPEEEWIEGLTNHLETIVNLRIDHVRKWLTVNLSRFQAGHASIKDLRRTFENAIVDLKGNVQLCKLQCTGCQLLCIQSRLHDGPHHCQADHLCVHECNFCMEPSGERKQCTMTCVVTKHLCGKPCKFMGRHGCLDACIKLPIRKVTLVLALLSFGRLTNFAAMLIIFAMNATPDFVLFRVNYASAYALTRTTCMALSRMQSIFAGKNIYALLCALPPVYVRLKRRPSPSKPLSREKTRLISTPSILKVRSSIRAVNYLLMFIGAAAKRLKCIKPIGPGATKHRGSHNHSLDKVDHFCENRCENCGYYCTLPLGN